MKGEQLEEREVGDKGRRGDGRKEWRWVKLGWKERKEVRGEEVEEAEGRR